MNNTTANNDTRGAGTQSPETLRDAMVDTVQKAGYALRPEVEQVLRSVPRHEFVPDAELAAVYDPWNAVVTHRFADGTSRSCISAPFVVAMMLDQLAVQPGQRILEIGAGTGYNAALLAELTGSGEDVVTIDIDPSVTAQATDALAATSHPDVRVITGDGVLGTPEHAPYDRIIVTVSPWDIPPAWWQQLAPGARLVLPLRWRGQARSVAFTYQDGRLVADSIQLCGFVYLVSDDDGEQAGPITHDQKIKLHWDRDQPINLTTLQGVLDQPRTTAWSGVTIAPDEPYDGVWLHLTATDPRVCRINAPADIPPEICDPIQAFRSPALVDGNSLAYLTSRRHHTLWELGAIGHGPTADNLTTHLCDEIRNWSTHRDQRKPTLIAYPTHTTPTTPAIPKTHTTLTLTYDHA